MIRSCENTFSFSAEEIGCVDPKVIAPMVIFTLPHVPWDLKPIPVPRAMLPKLIDLLKEKMRMGILEPSMAPYSKPLHALLKKGKRFSWSLEHHEAMEKLKKALQSPPVLRRLDYTCGRPIVVTVDTSPRAVGWAIGQDDSDGVRFAGRFGAKI
ncbi:hypothetical protein R1sor_020372 [Riccia sorocarpa]|uniref:Reverse transcriptase/retrotransposon-derived protein RNase H-like domain-containing protein n=1 Tax=Riccia sorocarpa TaxID=122646 RepID=A0ABD3IJ08_9MARC